MRLLLVFLCLGRNCRLSWGICLESINRQVVRCAMRRPLVVWASGLGIGIVLAERFGPWAILLVGALWVLQPFTRTDWLVHMAAAALLGCLLMTWHTPVWPGSFGTYRLQGHITATGQTATSKSAVIQVSQWAGRNVPWWNPVKVRITYAKGTPQLGGRVDLELTMRPLPQADNPGEFAYGQYLQRQGILAVASIEELPTTADYGRKSPIRQLLLARAQQLGGNAGELLSTLLLGGSPGKWADAWRQTGTSHILAVSGLHVGLLFLLLERLLALCRLPQKPRLILGGLMLLGYGLLIGFRPSVWRAIIMALVGLVAILTGRMKDWPSAVALAALLLLLLNPNLLFDAGFQLSFAATISLFTIAPRLKALLPVLPWQLDTAISASIAAQVATLPLVLYHFHLLSPFALVANMLLLPILPLVMALGLLWIVLPWPLLIRPVVLFMFNAMLWLVNWMSNWPLVSFSPGAAPVWLAVCYVILLAILLIKPWPGLQHILTSVWVFSLVLLVSWHPLIRGLSGQHQLAVLSVGQGSASALHLPGGEALLFDTGGSDDSAGDWTIVPYLRWRGTWKVRTVYLSHLHADHCIGLEAVLDAFPVGKVVIPRSGLGTDAYVALLELCQRYRTKVETMVAGEDHRYGLLSVESIHQGADDATSDENTGSLVLQLEYQQFSMLLSGDIGMAEERSILPYITSPLDVLLVAHHGSATSSAAEFLSSLQPEDSIISTGPNRYGHPAPAVLERLSLFGSKTWRTDKHGAILINTNGGEYHIKSWHNATP